jgi:hypothetical protein
MILGMAMFGGAVLGARFAIRNSIGKSLVEAHFPDGGLGFRFESIGIRCLCKCPGLQQCTIAR